MGRSIKGLILLALVVFATSMVSSVAAPPSSSVIVSCPFSSSAGDGLDRGFYVTSYPGSNLATVNLQYHASPSGTYTISITARSGAYNGPIIGSTQTVTVNLPSLSSYLDVVFDFGGAPVTPGSTITFAQKQIAGPGTAYFNVGTGALGGSGPCPGVTETDGTTPPLDSFRRQSVGLRISQLTVASTDWAVASVGVQPPSPNVGDAVTLWAKVVALSTTGSYPQSFIAQCTLDGNSCGSGSLSYAGPTGVTFTVSSQTPWIATAGTHTLNWQVSGTNDPNPGNNFGSYTFSVAAPTPFDFDISTSPSSLTVQPGQTQSASVNVNLKSGTAQQVSLTVSGQPSGVTASLNPTSGTPTFSSSLTIVVSSSASPGTYTLAIGGSGGGQSHSTSLALTISAAPDFRIDLSPASQSAAQGQVTSYSVNVVGSNGFNSQVSLSVTGLPPGANGVFSVSSGTPNFPSTLTVTLGSGTPSGSYTLVIHGTGGGLDRTANAVLIVTASTSQTQQQTTTQSATASSTGLVDMLEQNSLIIIAALILLAIVLALLAMRRGRSRPAGPTPAGPSQVFCSKCGSGNPAGNEFCSKCGNKLKGS